MINMLAVAYVIFSPEKSSSACDVMMTFRHGQSHMINMLAVAHVIFSPEKSSSACDVMMTFRHGQSHMINMLAMAHVIFSPEKSSILNMTLSESDLYQWRIAPPPPLPLYRVPKTKNDHILDEIWSRMRHFRHKISKFSTNTSCDVYKISAPPPSLSNHGSTTVYHNA